MSSEKLQLIFDEVKKLIILDGVDPNHHDLIGLVTQALNSDTYIKSIKETIDEIYKDKKVDVTDIPMLILLTLQIIRSLPRLLRLTKDISLSDVKYVIYSSIVYYIRELDDHGINFDSLRTMFGSLWSLVEINPATILAVGRFCTC